MVRFEPRFGAVFLLAGLVGAVACGARSTLDPIDLEGLEGGAGSSSGASQSSSSGGSGAIGGSTSSGGSSSSGTTSSTSSSGGTSSSSSSSGGGSSSSTSSSSGVSRDAGPVPPVDAGVSATIACGTASCDAATQQCCISLAPGGMGATSTCAPRASPCLAGVSLACSGAENCTEGKLCCLVMNGAFGLSTACEAVCPMGPAGIGDVELCSTNAQCTAGRRCVITPFGFGLCN